MNKKLLLGMFGLALLLGAGCASADASFSASGSGEKNGFVDRRTSSPPSAPENIPPPTEVQPEGEE